MPDKLKSNYDSVSDAELVEVSEVFKVLGDFTRIRILTKLLKENECSQGNIALNLNMSPSAISHQLKTLKQSRLVKSRRLGKMVYYSLDDEHVNLIIGMAIEHIKHTEQS